MADAVVEVDVVTVGVDAVTVEVAAVVEWADVVGADAVVEVDVVGEDHRPNKSLTECRKRKQAE